MSNSEKTLRVEVGNDTQIKMDEGWKAVEKTQWQSVGGQWLKAVNEKRNTKCLKIVGKSTDK